MAFRVLVCLIWTVLQMLFVSGTVYFREDFSDGEDWEDRWIQSDAYSSHFQCVNSEIEALEAGTDYQCGSIRTTIDDKFYAISSSEMLEAFNNKDKLLIIQYRYKYYEKIR